MQTILVFSHLRWNFVYQRPQHLLSRLARSHRILFLEEPVRGDGPPTLDVNAVSPNMQILRPCTPVARPGFCDEQLSIIESLLGECLVSLGASEYGVWFYTPMAWPLMRILHPTFVIYDCMDELTAFLGAPPELREREAALLRRADVVLTGGPSLYEAKRNSHPRILCLPSSVDASHFAVASSLTPAVGTGRPQLGFFGVIDERMNIGLLADLAEREPGWDFIMVGPVVKIDPRTLPRASNIHWLGQREYADLPSLIAGWDICLMPFAINEATRFISPTKTLEYMAAAKPVVSTPIKDVVTLYGDVVQIADDAEGFQDACRRLLAETPSQRAVRERAMAMAVSRSSWDFTVCAIEAELQAVMKRRSKREDPAAPEYQPAQISA